MNIIQLVDIFFPVYFTIFIGVFFAKLKLASTFNLSGANNFVFWVSIPALVFHSLSQSELPHLSALKLLGIYFSMAILVFLLAFWSSKHIALLRADRTVFSMGSNYSNTILLGLPIISEVMGQSGVLTLFWIVILHAAILFTLAVFSLEFSEPAANREQNVARLARSITQNPVALASVAGIIFSFTTFTMPDFINRSLTLVGKASVPMGLFLIGTSLGSCGAFVKVKAAVLSSLFKIILLPLLVSILGVYVFKFPHDWVMAAVLTAGLPVGVSLVIFAERLDVTEGFASTIFFVSTTLSLISIPFWVMLFSQFI